MTDKQTDADTKPDTGSEDALRGSVSSPRLSIIVPVYNAEHYLSSCLESIARQTLRDFECILVDDGSPDSSGAICDEWAARDSRFRVIHKQNAGTAAARNTGLETARGEWAAFIDNDDTIEPTMYEELLAAADRADAELVACGYVLDFGDPKKNVRVLWPGGDLTRCLMLKSGEKSHIANYIWVKVAKKTLYTRNNIRFNEDVGISDDVLASFFLVFYARKTALVNKAFYHYNQINSTAVSYKISHEHKVRPRKTSKPSQDVIPLIEALYRTDKSLDPRLIDRFINTWKMSRKTNALSMRHDAVSFRETYPEFNRLRCASYCVRPVQRVWFLLGMLHLAPLAFALQKVSRAVSGRK